MVAIRTKNRTGVLMSGYKSGEIDWDDYLDIKFD